MSTQDHSPASSTSFGTASPHRIVIITTGGAIVCIMGRSGALTPTVLGMELIATVSQHYSKGMLKLEARRLDVLDSLSLAFTGVNRILATIHEVLGDDSVGGVIATHGMDTVEETAMAADTFHTDSYPVVLTGIQLPHGHPETDRPGNLFEAVIIASDASAQGIGVFAIFGHAILPIRDATKWHTADPLALTTNALEELVRPDSLPLAALTGSKIEIIPAYLGTDGLLLDSAVTTGVRDIIVGGLGPGNISDEFAVTTDRVVSVDVTVVMATCVPHGDIHAAYGDVDDGATLARYGVISAGCVYTSQVRITLAATLAVNMHPQALF